MAWGYLGWQTPRCFPNGLRFPQHADTEKVKYAVDPPKPTDPQTLMVLIQGSD